MKETVKTRPSREYGVLQHSAILRTGREERACERRRKEKAKLVDNFVEQ